jgi:hypothetical protein
MEFVDELEYICCTSSYKIVKHIFDQIKTPLSIDKYIRLTSSCIEPEYIRCADAYGKEIHEENIKTIRDHYYYHLNNSFYEFILISYKYNLFDKHIFKQIYAYMPENIFDDMWRYESIWKIKDKKLFIQILSLILSNPDNLPDFIDNIPIKCILKNKRRIKLLIRMMIEKNLSEYIFTEFASHIYYEKEPYAALVKILVECNVDLNYEFDREYSDADGPKYKTWLGRAVFMGKFDNCKALLDGGAIPTPEMIEKAVGANISQEIIDLLRDKIN